jgi:hypothetical protein
MQVICLQLSADARTELLALMRHIYQAFYILHM